MLKFLGNIFFKSLQILDKLLKKFGKPSLLEFLNNKIYVKNLTSYTSVKINNKRISFQTNSSILKWRIDTFFSKEPDTLKWIDSFNNKKNIFWDVGANIGLYSIYAATKFPNYNIVSFEPSFNNLKVLSENIFKNNFQNQIKIFQIGLSDLKNSFQILNESSLLEGGAHNNLGDNIDFQGKRFDPIKQYQIFSNSIDKILDDKILLPPNYIKIDVDGIEHKILDGAKNLLCKKDIVDEVLIEINMNYREQYDKIKKIMEKSNFKIIKKISLDKENTFFNFIFKKQV